MATIFTIRATISKNEEEANSPKVEAAVFNEESKGRQAEGTEDDVNAWLLQKEVELTSLIAKQTKLKPSHISIVLAPIPSTENKEEINVTCSILLKTEATFENETINRIIKNIVHTISKQETVKATISEENIVMMNSNQDVLY